MPPGPPKGGEKKPKFPPLGGQGGHSINSGFELRNSCGNQRLEGFLIPLCSIRNDRRGYSRLSRTGLLPTLTIAGLKNYKHRG